MRVRKRAAYRAKSGYNLANGIKIRFAANNSRAERAEMNDLKTLEDRLKLATDRISAALSADNTQSGQLEVAHETNAELQRQISAFKVDRENDLAEVNNLIEQIRPLMEGNDDA